MRMRYEDMWNGLVWNDILGGIGIYRDVFDKVGVCVCRGCGCYGMS